MAIIGDDIKDAFKNLTAKETELCDRVKELREKITNPDEPIGALLDDLDLLGGDMLALQSDYELIVNKVKDRETRLKSLDMPAKSFLYELVKMQEAVHKLEVMHTNYRLTDSKMRELIALIRMRGAQYDRDLIESEASNLKAQQRENKKKAADILHNKPGGTREKQKQLRAIWATGKYTSRDRCAEEECAALDMSFSAARKALRNTPNGSGTLDEAGVESATNIGAA